MQKRIESYQLIKEIGSGGFGEVHLARQDVINRDVAIKVILPLYANRDDFIRRFQFEAELIAGLEHPHIVPIFDFWRDPTGAYLVMRYIKNNLADYLLTDGAMTMTDAARLLEQIAGALHTAHRNRVIHQDIKPANILLDDDLNAYLTDFGIARDIDSGIDLSQDESNTMHGSPKYISPEHLRRREITARSDIYSLGILMYEVLTGHPPFDHDDMLQLLQMHVKKDLPALNTHRPDLPDALNQPLQQATLKDPMLRYSNALEFARDFRMIVARQSGDITGSINFPANIVFESTEPIEIRNPYKGLRAFKESDKDDFYGREALIKSLIKSMTVKSPYQRFMAIVGASGSGKSSVIRAGLIPALRNGDIMGLPPLYISTMIPGNHPMRSLEGAILKVASRASVKLMQTISKNSYDLNQVLIDALPEDGEMVLLIDQFEELFTQVADETIRSTFLSMIHDALMVHDSRLRVIATLRADFLDYPLQYPQWGQLFRERMELIPAMTQAELRSAIEDPAEANNLMLEPGLTAMILGDVRSERGALPLLQYTLSELYERRTGIEMTIASYEEIDGLSGALAKRADELYLTLEPDERAITRLIFTRLVRVGDRQDNTRQRLLLSDLHSIKYDKDKVQSVIDTFGKYRLLTFDNETSSRLPTVEIVHEALIRSWGLLRGWIDDNADALRLQARLGDAASLWKDGDKDESYLATGLRLQQFATLEAHDIIALTKLERDFLDASIAADEQRKLRAKQRQQLFDMLRSAILVLAVIAGIAAVFAVMQRNEALAARDDAQNNARESRARELAASSLLFAGSEPDLSLLLALESLAVQDTFEGQSALLDGLLTRVNLAGYYHGNDSIVRTVAIAPDGASLATGAQDGAVIVWDTATRNLLWQSDAHSTRVNTVTFHPDSGQLATADGDGIINIFDVTTGDVITQISHNDEEVRALTYAPDGDTLASGNAGGNITFWQTGDYSEIDTINTHDGEVIYSLVYSPDGNTLASGGGDDLIRIWSSDDRDEIRQIVGHEDWVLALAFSPDGTQLASGSVDRTVRLWDVSTGENIWGFRNHAAEVFALTFSDDARFVISGDVLDRIIYWNAASGNIQSSSNTYENTGVRGLADYNNSLFIVGDTPDVIEVNIGFVPRLGDTIITAEEEIFSSAVSDTGVIAYAGGQEADFNIYVYEGESVSTLELHSAGVNALVWQDDRLLSGSIDRTVGVHENNTLIGTISAPDAVISLDVHDNLVAIGTNSGMISLWDITGDVSDWSEINTLTGHSNRVSDLAFNSDGTQLVSASRDGTLILWDIATQSAVHDPFVGHTAAVESVAFHPDDRLIASGSRDLTIMLWDATTGQPAAPPLERHENWVTDLAFSPDGSQMASVSGDRAVILWDVETQRVLGLPLIGHLDWINTVSYAPDGDTIVTGSRDTQLIAWQTDLNTWQTIACQIINRDFTDGEQRDFFADNVPSGTICE